MYTDNYTYTPATYDQRPTFWNDEVNNPMTTHRLASSGRDWNGSGQAGTGQNGAASGTNGSGQNGHGWGGGLC